jgi:hypothetical protein
VLHNIWFGHPYSTEDEWRGGRYGEAYHHEKKHYGYQPKTKILFWKESILSARPRVYSNSIHLWTVVVFGATS